MVFVLVMIESQLEIALFHLNNGNTTINEDLN